MIEFFLFSVVCVCMFVGNWLLINVSGFFFECDGCFFVVISWYVMYDKLSKYFFDCIEVELYIDLENMVRLIGFFILFYCNGKGIWCQGLDMVGEIDVVVIEIECVVLLLIVVYCVFMFEYLIGLSDQVEIGLFLLVVGFLLGFYDMLYYMLVVCYVVLVLLFGLCFQGEGYFLIDVCMYCGMSGVLVVMWMLSSDLKVYGDLFWILFGVYFLRLDVGMCDLKLDEVLGLNCVWYVDILMILIKKF